jgi:hypothetical protein
MSQKIEISRVQPRSILPSGSRYMKQNVIYYGEKRIITFDTYNREKYEPNGREKVMVINKGVEYRPDLVSYDYYGFTDNWWRILEVNGIKDIFEFKAGKTIVLPDRVL